MEASSTQSFVLAKPVASTIRQKVQVQLRVQLPSQSQADSGIAGHAGKGRRFNSVQALSALALSGGLLVRTRARLRRRRSHVTARRSFELFFDVPNLLVALSPDLPVPSIAEVQASASGLSDIASNGFGMAVDGVSAQIGQASQSVSSAAATVSSILQDIARDPQLAEKNLEASLSPERLGELTKALSELLGKALGNLPPEFAAAFKDPLAESVKAPAAAGVALVALLGLRRGPQPWLSELPRRYDAAWIEAYWNRRPLQLLSKLFSVGSKLGYFTLLLQLDKATGKEDENMPARAEQARELVTDLGVAFIKIAQVQATRPDLLAAPYQKEFEKLLEQVRPFGKDKAFETLRRAFPDVEGLFDSVSAFEKPVASASVGQVYKASIKGKEVAVKVQRPDVREQVTIDIYVIRSACKFAASLPFDRIAKQAKSSLDLIDIAAPTWFEELDYKAEAANQEKFAGTVESCELIRDSIVVPKVVMATGEVLVQEWLEGKKLSDPNLKEKAPQVVNLLLNAYMVQFLETGFLHGDPHPGNFILLPSGQLGILDYGLMTTIKADKRVAFIEYLMHLQAKEYDSCLQDLINLEFIPAEIGDDREAREILVPALASTLSTLYSEGGDMNKKQEIFAKKREEMKGTGKLEQLQAQLQAISKKYGSFQLPGYFTLIIRAFSTLEGLGLRVDQNFNIVQECFPYIARRLLTDDSLRIREALKSYLYMGRRRVAVKRIDDLAKGFGTFTNLMKGDRAEYISKESSAEKVHIEQPKPSAASSSSTSPPKLDGATKDIADVIFSPGGNFLQDILIDEGVAAVDALSRAALLQLLRTLGPLSLPLTLPLGLLLGGQAESKILAREDKEALLLLRRIVQIIQVPGSEPREESPSFTGEDIRGAAEALQRLQPLAQGLLPAVAPGATAFASRFAQQLTRRILLRLAQDIEQGAGLGRNRNRQASPA